MSKFLGNSLLTGLMSLAVCACSNEEMLNSTPQISEENAHLNIIINTPASDGIVVRSRAAENTLFPDEAHESAIKSLNVYLFKKGTGTSDADYTYFEHQTVAEFNDGIGGNGQKTCSVKINPKLMNENVKIVLIANDEPKTESSTIQLEKGKTTLPDFRTQALATAVVSDRDNADKLVGGYKAEAATGFPMSAVSGDTRLTAAGSPVEMTLVRNVARLDIQNNAPGLIIKSVKVKNVNNKSLLLDSGTEDSPINVPVSEKINLNPLTEYSTLLTNGIEYQEGIDEDAIKKNNTHCAFYLYEQKVEKQAESPVVTIEYEINTGNTVNNLEGSLDVLFKNTNTFVSVGRNKRYVILLGDGTPVDNGNVKAKLIVEDWKHGEDFNEVINPGGDSETIG